MSEDLNQHDAESFSVSPENSVSDSDSSEHPAEVAVRSCERCGSFFNDVDQPYCEQCLPFGTNIAQVFAHIGALHYDLLISHCLQLLRVSGRARLIVMLHYVSSFVLFAGLCLCLGVICVPGISPFLKSLILGLLGLQCITLAYALESNVRIVCGEFLEGKKVKFSEVFQYQHLPRILAATPALFWHYLADSVRSFPWVFLTVLVLVPIGFLFQETKVGFGLLMIVTGLTLILFLGMFSQVSETIRVTLVPEIVNFPEQSAWTCAQSSLRFYSAMDPQIEMPSLSEYFSELNLSFGEHYLLRIALSRVYPVALCYALWGVAYAMTQQQESEGPDPLVEAEAESE